MLGILCGVVCAVCVLAFMQTVRGEADAARAEAMAKYGGEQLEVCVATRDIAAGEVVSAADVDTRMWLVDLLPSDAVRDSSEIVGKQTSSSVLAGEVVSLQRFQSVDSVIDVPDDLCAISVPAKEVQAVGGAISPGSLVDMFVTGDSSTELVASNIQVLATGNALQKSSSPNSSGATSWVTLAVKPAQVQEMVAAAARAELYFSLPGSGVAENNGSGDAGKASETGAADANMAVTDEAKAAETQTGKASETDDANVVEKESKAANATKKEADK